MKCQIPQISWHDRTPVLSADFQFIDKDLRRLATGGSDAHVLIWYINLCPNNTVTVEVACQLSRHNKSINVVRFSPNGEYLASGDDEGAIFIWKFREILKTPDLDEDGIIVNREDWYPLKLLRGHLDDICDLNWSPDSEFLISGSIDNSAIVWDVQKGQNVRVLKEAKSFIQGVSWDPLNQYQATISSDRVLRIYNASSGKIQHRIHKGPWAETADKISGKGNKLFHDDTLQSFCRRLSFSPDGELLFVPSGIKEKEDVLIHTTYVFSRYEFVRPVMHFPTGLKYTLAVRCCPVLFKLRRNVENTESGIIALPYRILIAVATQESILLYDTQQLLPFGCISNIHYTHLTDLSWSPDGRMLIISSTDGFCSFIIFNEGELGEIHIPEKKTVEIEVTPTPVEQPSTDMEMKTDNITPSDVLNESIEVGKDPMSNNDFAQSPNSSICKTLKRPPSSNKKLYTIKNFFSPPGKKAKKEYLDDCVVIKEMLNFEKIKSAPVDTENDVEMMEISDEAILSENSNEKQNDLKTIANSGIILNVLPNNLEPQIKPTDIKSTESLIILDCGTLDKKKSSYSGNARISTIDKDANINHLEADNTKSKNSTSILETDIQEKSNACSLAVPITIENCSSNVEIAKENVKTTNEIVEIANENVKPANVNAKPKKRITFTTLSSKVTSQKE